MFCIKCGSKLDKDTLYCPKCGLAVDEEENKDSSDSLKPVENPGNTVPDNRNNGVKTASIVLGVISIITCCTIFIPIILGIVGIILAVKARKVDPTFKAGFILNIIGIVLIVFPILAFTGLILFGLKTESRLTKSWCCSDTTDTSACAIKLDLDDDYTYTIYDQHKTLESNGTWDYEWSDHTKLRGDEYELTLDGYDYTAYLKDDEMKLYDDHDTSYTVMYCKSN